MRRVLGAVQYSFHLRYIMMYKHTHTYQYNNVWQCNAISPSQPLTHGLTYSCYKTLHRKLHKSLIKNTNSRTRLKKDYRKLPEYKKYRSALPPAIFRQFCRLHFACKRHYRFVELIDTYTYTKVRLRKRKFYQDYP